MMIFRKNYIIFPWGDRLSHGEVHRAMVTMMVTIGDAMGGVISSGDVYHTNGIVGHPMGCGKPSAECNITQDEDLCLTVSGHGKDWKPKSWCCSLVQEA